MERRLPACKPMQPGMAALRSDHGRASLCPGLPPSPRLRRVGCPCHFGSDPRLRAGPCRRSEDPPAGFCAQKQEGPGTLRFRGQTWGWELATLSSRSHTLGALAFAGRVLPDATPRGMRRFQSHGGTVPAVASRNLSSEASTPGSATACQQRSRQTGCRHACNLRRSRRHRYHGVGPGFWPGVSPMLRV